MATLSALAEVESRVQCMFITKQKNNAGIYLLSFWVNGQETPVIVDDWIPCMNGQPCYAKTKSQEIWVMLAEKAWAKLHGSYDAIEGGTTSMASLHVQGVPSWNWIHETLET